MVVEDLHWADLASSQALLSAVKRLDEDKVLVVVTSRPGLRSPGFDSGVDPDRCRQVMLRDFGIDEVAALAAAIRGGVDHSPSGTAARAHPGAPDLCAHAPEGVDPAAASRRRRGPSGSPVARLVDHRPPVGASGTSSGPRRGDGGDQPAKPVANGGQGGRSTHADRTVRGLTVHRVRAMGSGRAWTAGSVCPPVVPPSRVSGSVSDPATRPAPGGGGGDALTNCSCAPCGGGGRH